MTNNDGTSVNGESTLAKLACDPALGARRHRAAAGATLHEPGTQANDLFLIRQGQVRLYQLATDGSQRLLDILGPGDWFGVEALGPVTRYGSQARAMTDTLVCVLSARRLLAALPQNSKASLEMIHQLAGRLSMATEEAARLAFDDCRRRLLKALLKFSHSAAATATGDSVILRITHEQLAQAVGAARETVSLTLTQLRNAKLLKTGRNRLTFNPRDLDQVLNFQ